MSEVLDRLQESRNRVWEQAKELADKAAAESRAFDGTEESTWQTLNAELEALDKRMQNVLDGEQRAADTAAAFDKLQGRKPDREVRGQNGQSDGDELRKFLRGEGPRAFEVKPPAKFDFRKAVAEARSLSVGAATAGGDTVPTMFYNRLIQHLIQNSAIMQAGVTVLNTSGGETIQVPKTTAHSTGGLVDSAGSGDGRGEGMTIPSEDPTFGQISLNAYKYGILLQISRELLDDTGVDLEGYLSMQAGRALGNAFGAHAVGGTGTKQPRGVITDATLGKTGTTGVVGVFSADDLIDLQYSVIAPYRASQACYWLMQDVTIAQVRKLKDANGQYLWQPSVQVGAPDILLGKPVLTDPNVPATGTSHKSVLFGDFSQYFVRMAGGLRFERSDDFAFDTDLVTYRCLMRADGSLVDLTGAIKYFAGASS